MGRTSTEAKYRWNSANYRSYRISLRIEEDRELIEYIEKYTAARKGKGVTDMFRAGVEQFMQEGRK